MPDENLQPIEEVEEKPKKKMPDFRKVVRPLIALAVTFIFCKLSWEGKIEPKDALSAFVMVATFYFVSRENSKMMETFFDKFRSIMKESK